MNSSAVAQLKVPIGQQLRQLRVLVPRKNLRPNNQRLKAAARWLKHIVLRDLVAVDMAGSIALADLIAVEKHNIHAVHHPKVEVVVLSVIQVVPGERDRGTEGQRDRETEGQKETERQRENVCV